MNDLITIQPAKIGGTLTETVNARQLYDALAPTQRFSDWISYRIGQYGFQENQDYTIFSEKSRENTGLFSRGRPEKGYYITTDMAKELCMLERSEKGRQFRRYFIAREREAIEKGRHLQAMAAELLPHRPLWRQIKRYVELGLTNVEIGKLCGCHRDRVRKHRRRMEACGLIEPPANLARMQQQALRLPHPGGAS